MYKKLSSAQIQKIAHGAVKSFLLYSLKQGATVYEFEKTFYKVVYKKKQIYFHAGSFPIQQGFGKLSKNKFATNFILKENGISVSAGFSYKKGDTLEKKSIDKLRFPLITKPLDGSLARGVQWNITSFPELKKMVGKSLKHSKVGEILIEEQTLGDEYRLLVYGGKFLSCVKKSPAQVLGDGSSSINELIKKYNASRPAAYTIQPDEEIHSKLTAAGLSYDSVPSKNERVVLRNRLNCSLGGKLTDVTHLTHKDYKRVASEAVELLGLTFGGVDIITNDITNFSNYIVLEVNSRPFYNMHEKPLVDGRGINVSKKIFHDIFK